MSNSKWPPGTKLSVKEDVKMGIFEKEWILPKGTTGTADDHGYWVKLDRPFNSVGHVNLPPEKFELIVPFETIPWILE